MTERLQPGHLDQESGGCTHNARTHGSHRHLSLLRAWGFSLLALAAWLTPPQAQRRAGAEPQPPSPCLHPGLARDWPLPCLCSLGAGGPLPGTPPQTPLAPSLPASSPVQRVSLRGLLLPRCPLQVIPAHTTGAQMPLVPPHSPRQGHGLPGAALLTSNPMLQPSTGMAPGCGRGHGDHGLRCPPSSSLGPDLWLPHWGSTLPQFGKVA